MANALEAPWGMHGTTLVWGGEAVVKNTIACFFLHCLVFFAFFSSRFVQHPPFSSFVPQTDCKNWSYELGEALVPFRGGGVANMTKQIGTKMPNSGGG